MTEIKQWLSDDELAYTNEFMMIRVDKGKSELAGNRPFERWDPQFWDPKHQSILAEMKQNYKLEPLGKFIKFMTYGQVGKRVYSKIGTVHYIQTINMIDTGIDYYVKPAFIEEDSWNDLTRSRLEKYDILLGNAGMGGLGKVCIFLDDDRKVNISQDIDLIRVSGINPFYVAAFLMSKYGNTQIWYHSKGVGAPKIPFDEVRTILIPMIPKTTQKQFERNILQLHKYHIEFIKLRHNKEDSLKTVRDKANQLLTEILDSVDMLIQKRSS